MTDENNKPADDIEAAADAAATEEAAKPEEQRDDAPPPPPPPEDEKKAEPEKPASKKASKKKAPKRRKPGTAVRNTLKTQKETRQKAVADADPDRAEREKTAADKLADETNARIEKVGEICDSMAELHEAAQADDEAAAKYEELFEQLRETALAGDVAEYAAELDAKANELEAEALRVRKLYADILVRPKSDDGRTHQERLKAVHARSKEIREQRARDRLKMLAKGASRSPLDTALAERPRTSQADADANANANTGE